MKEGMTMTEFKELFQSADWKAEKHVPVISVSDSPEKGGMLKATITVGKEIAHPNTTEHHIRWIELYFHPEGEKFPIELGRFEFTSHGESAGGANTSTVYTHSEAVCSFKTDKPGTLFASSYCNIHGLWSSSHALKF